MKIPKKTKFRKAHRGRMKGVSKGAREIFFGEYGLQALEPIWLTAQQIECLRATVARHLKKKKGKLFMRVFADKPVSKKPAETRMGKGKGPVEKWVSVVKRERIIAEISGVDEETARYALRIAACKMPMKTRFIAKEKEVDYIEAKVD